MTRERIEEIAGRVVELVFGAGYVSSGAASVFQGTVEILSNVPEAMVPALSERLVEMCRAVGAEAAEVGFE